MWIKIPALYSHKQMPIMCLRQKPKLPEPCDSNSPIKAFPKPPTDPVEVKSRLAGARGRFLRVETLVDGDANGTRAKYVIKGF